MPQPDPGKIMNRLLRWSGQDDWEWYRAYILAGHLGLISDMLDLHSHEIFDLIGDASTLLLAFIMEDFLTTWFEEQDGRNAINSYLDRHGWREDVWSKRYLEALNASMAMLYEVCDTGPGRAITVRSLMSDADPETVVNPELLDDAERGDCFAGCLVGVGRDLYLTKGLLYYPPEIAKTACATLNGLANRYLERTHQKATRPAGEDVDDVVMQGASSFTRVVSQILTGYWVTTAMRKILDDLPRIRNSDGEKIRFFDVGFPLRADAGEVAAILDQIDVFGRGSEDEWCWMWHNPNSSKAPLREGTGENADLEPMPLSCESAIGVVNLKSDALVLSVNSRERAKQGQGLLTSRLGRRLGRSRTTRRNPEQTLKESLRRLSSSPEPDRDGWLENLQFRGERPFRDRLLFGRMLWRMGRLFGRASDP